MGTGTGTLKLTGLTGPRVLLHPSADAVVDTMDPNSARPARETAAAVWDSPTVAVRAYPLRLRLTVVLTYETART